MTARTDVVGYVRDQTRPALEAVGGFTRMCVLTARGLLRPFQWREFILQSWFLFRVSFLPTLAVSAPLTVLLIFLLNILLAEFGVAAGGGIVDVRRPRVDDPLALLVGLPSRCRAPGNASITTVADLLAPTG